MAAQRRGANLLRTAPMGVPHEKIYGIEAARAVMATRPGDVIRIAHTSAVRHEIAELLREAAAQRIAYGEHSEEDLGKLAGALHHEGICLAVQPRRVLSVDALVNALRDGKCRAVLARSTRSRTRTTPARWCGAPRSSGSTRSWSRARRASRW